MDNKTKIMIQRIRTGEIPNVTIKKDDPYALQKLEAQRDCLVEEREFKKIANRNARFKKQRLPYEPTELSNLSSKISKLTNRIIELSK